MINNQLSLYQQAKKAYEAAAVKTARVSQRD